MICLQLSDSGIYTCVAASSSGETSWSAFLEVKGTPFDNKVNKRQVRHLKSLVGVPMRKHSSQNVQLTA